MERAPLIGISPIIFFPKFIFLLKQYGLNFDLNL